MGAIKPSLWTDTYLTLWNDQCLEELFSKLWTRVGKIFFEHLPSSIDNSIACLLNLILHNWWRGQWGKKSLIWGWGGDKPLLPVCCPLPIFTDQPTNPVSAQPHTSHISRFTNKVECSQAGRVDNRNLTGSDPTFLDAPASYILKADVLDVPTPQKIQIFRRKIVWERENFQSQSLKANNFAMCYK